MNIVITMAGLGSRFLEAGYACPKYMIEAKGKTLFEWSMMSLLDYNKYVNKYIFVARKEHDARAFIFKKMLEIGVSNIDVIEIDYNTSGQAETALLAMNHCDVNDSVLIYNIDTFVEPYVLKYEVLGGDGHIPCFHAPGSHWSFIKEENGKVVDVVEKRRISDNCSIGVYYFKSAALFCSVYSSYYANSDKKGEKYIAPMYKKMIDEGYNITYSMIDSTAVHVLGTPKELEVFCNEEVNL